MCCPFHRSRGQCNPNSSALSIDIDLKLDRARPFLSSNPLLCDVHNFGKPHKRLRHRNEGRAWYRASRIECIVETYERFLSFILSGADEVPLNGSSHLHIASYFFSE